MNTRYCLQTTCNETVKMIINQGFYHTAKPYSTFRPVVCKHWLWAILKTTPVFQHIRSEDISSCSLSWLDHLLYHINADIKSFEYLQLSAYYKNKHLYLPHFHQSIPCIMDPYNICNFVHVQVPHSSSSKNMLAFGAVIMN